MKNTIPYGVYPTMITPYTDDNKIDYAAVEKLMYWYKEKGVAGIFAICQSSEIFFLSANERLELIKFIMAHKPEGLTILASGHVADDLDTQAKEAQAVIDTGIDAFVFISNRFAKKDEDDSVFMKNLMYVADRLEGAPLGFYECPYPYKRCLTPEIMKELASTGKFCFTKDTCCDIKQIEAKIKAVEGTSFGLYNANAATLYDSLKLGAKGYSGVMANFHPELYAELCKCWDKDSTRAKLISDFVGFASVAECQCYPVNAKYYLGLEGIEMNIDSRSKNKTEFFSSRKQEIEQMREVTLGFEKYINL